MKTDRISKSYLSILSNSEKKKRKSVRYKKNSCTYDCFFNVLVCIANVLVGLVSQGGVKYLVASVFQGSMNIQPLYFIACATVTVHHFLCTV